MADPTLVIVGSFLLAFKAILVEGTEVAILALATVRQLGKRNVLTGVLLGAGGSFLVFLFVWQVFVALPEILVDFATGAVLLYFSSRFLRGFAKYYFGKKSFREKMEKMSAEVIEKDRAHAADGGAGPLPFSLVNALPVLTITLTEGFEASLVVAAAGAFNIFWTTVGGLASIGLLVVVSAISYEYLLRVPRWFVDLLAGCVLLTFGVIFVVTGVLSVL